MTSERIKAVGESTPPLSIGFDIAIAMCRRADVLGHPYPSPELRVWLANQITIAVNAARSSSPTPDGVIKERGSDGRRPDGPGLSHSVSSPSVSPAAAASIPGAGEVDFDSLNALFAKIPSGPWDARRDSDGHEIRQIDTDPTNKHHWPFRLCRSIPGQRAGCDDAVFDFLAGVLNVWPQIAAAHSEEAEVERILAMSGAELDARLRLDGRDPDDVLALADYALRTATMQAALETISSQYVTNRGDMTAEEALATIKGIADRARDPRPLRGTTCQCGACTPDVTHASDCAVHAEPAAPSGPCTCNAPGIETGTATTEGRGPKDESPVTEGEAPASIDQDHPAPRPSQREG